MFGALRAMFRPPRPAGPEEIIRRYTIEDAPITKDGVSVDDGAWRIESDGPRTVRMFEFADPDVESAMVTYRAEMRTDGLDGKTYLEMWCRFPGRGEFFSKGLQHAVTGTTGWASYETPFFLKAGQRPDLIKLNLAVGGKGTVWLRDVTLLRTPLTF